MKNTDRVERKNRQKIKYAQYLTKTTKKYGSLLHGVFLNTLRKYKETF